MISSPLASRFQRPTLAFNVRCACEFSGEPVQSDSRRSAEHSNSIEARRPCKVEEAPPIVPLSARYVTIFSLAKELPVKMAANPVLHDVYIAVSCSGRPATTRARPLMSAGSFFPNRNCAAQAGLPSTATWWILNVGGAARCYPISSWTFCGSPPSERGLFFWSHAPSGNRRVQLADGSRRCAGDRSPDLPVSCRPAGGLTIVHNPQTRQSFARPAGAQ